LLSIAGGRTVRPVLCSVSVADGFFGVVCAEALPQHRIKLNVAIAMRMAFLIFVKQATTKRTIRSDRQLEVSETLTSSV
jgi:hypothetical protein